MSEVQSKRVQNPSWMFVASSIAVLTTSLVLLSPRNVLADGCPDPFPQCRIQIPQTGQQFTQTCTTICIPMKCKCNTGLSGQMDVTVIWNNCPDGLTFDPC
jgi:hypothetical protein